MKKTNNTIKLLKILFDSIILSSNISKNKYEILNKIIYEESHSFGIKPNLKYKERIIKKVDLILKTDIFSYYFFENEGIITTETTEYKLSSSDILFNYIEKEVLNEKKDYSTELMNLGKKEINILKEEEKKYKEIINLFLERNVVKDFKPIYEIKNYLATKLYQFPENKKSFKHKQKIN